MTPDDSTKIDSEVTAWALKTESYIPGGSSLLIRSAPSVWEFTKYWMPPILEAAPHMPIEKRLLTFFELNWRLEVCALPLFENVVNMITSCLEAINPFPDQSLIPHAQLQLSAANVHRTEPTWVDIKRCWIALSFAVLRFRREERRHDEFARWATRMEHIPLLSSDNRARICYERCLYALGEMDDESARNSLMSWPDSTADPVWQLRKAAVLTEIGEVREARSITERVITRLRTGLRQTTEDIPLLSREGWAMILMHGMLQLEWMSGQGRPPDERGRWDRLSRLACNPWTELDALRSRLSQPVPVPKESPHQRMRFQPGTVTSTVAFAESASSRNRLQAYQYMRLVEDGPLPPSVGNVTLSEKNLKAAAEWFIPYDPVRTQTLACRLLDSGDDAIDAYLSRHRVASLPQNVIDDFFRISIRTIEAVQKSAIYAGRPVTEVEALGRRSPTTGSSLRWKSSAA